jgi:hypothetical protein
MSTTTTSVTEIVNSYTGPVRIENGRVVFGDDSDVRAHYAQIDVGLDDVPEYARRATRHARLLQAQRTCHAVAQRPLELATNIYGWAVGSTLLSNLGGGRWALTPRGMTYAQAVAWGLAQCAAKGTTLTVGVCPAHQELVDAVLARQ